MIRRLAAACRAKQALIALTVAGVVVLTACGTRSAGPNASGGSTGTPSTTAAAASLAATPTAPSAGVSPYPAPPLFPEAPRVPVAGWQTVTASIWSGYTFPVSGVTGVRAQWTQPSATGRANAEALIWVGVGGWQQQSLIQSGTIAAAAYFGMTPIWYELLPAGPQYPQPSLNTVIPGDKIAVSIVQVPPEEKWRISVDDMSEDRTFTQVVHYDSAGTYPSFIVEYPHEGMSPSSPFVPFPHWGSVSFSNMQIRIGGQWKPAASVYGYRIQMVRNGRTLVSTGPLDKASGFTARQEH